MTQDNSTEESAVTIVTVEIPNAPQKGTITVSKTGKVFASVEGKGLYQPIFAVSGLSGATYEITAAEDIYTPDGTLRYSQGEVVDTITTGEDGTAESAELYLGRYTVRETEAPYGYVLNDEAQTVELTYTGQAVSVTETAASFYNERQKVSISLTKFMEQDDTFQIGMNGEITSVTFGLYAAEELTAADGSTIPADGLIDIISVAADGSAFCSTDLPLGSYYLKELSTDSHYILSDARYPVVFSYAGQEAALVQIIANDGEAIANELIYGTIRGLKIDRETEETITGAVFGLFAASETDFTAETAILTAETGEDGVFTFEHVPYGTWTVRELQPAEGYLSNDTCYVVQVNSDGQTIEITVANDLIPELGTTAAIDGEKEANATEVFTLTDVVEYAHLVPGAEYTVSGVLMDKATGEPLLIGGAEVRAETTFTPEEPSGSVAVEFTFDAKYIKADTDLVVFESLYRDGRELAVHADLEDAGQTVTLHVPEIGTTATAEDGEKETFAVGTVTIEDVVSYANLTPGVEYTVSGVLMDKATGEPLLVNGEEVRSEATFTPEAAEGEVTVAFVFDGSAITGTTETVVFETLCREGVEIAVHADIEDEGQTVTIHVPEIGTTATIDGEKEATADGKITIDDVVSYTGLIPGREYTIEGVLMDKATGDPFLVNSMEICSAVTFTPETADGEVTVSFTFKSSVITADTEIVVFETLYYGDTAIAIHADLEDEGQTVTIYPQPVTTTTPKTGDDRNPVLWIILMGVAAVGAAACGVFAARKKKKKEDD